jgi:hypothetical protein
MAWFYTVVAHPCVAPTLFPAAPPVFTLPVQPPPPPNPYAEMRDIISQMQAKIEEMLQVLQIERIK